MDDFVGDRPSGVGVPGHPEQLRAAGVTIGDQPYDFYTLETADDLAALSGVLSKHRYSAGRNPCIAMNFILANLDFDRMSAEGFRTIHGIALNEGLPQPWQRPASSSDFSSLRAKAP